MFESSYDRYYHYNRRHIYLLLKDKFKDDNQYIVLKPCNIMKINEVIKENICNVDNNITVVLPIFHSSENHWVGLVIKKEANILQAFYADSLDKSSNYLLNNENSIIKILKENNVHMIQLCLIKQHDNFHDCGPWTVFNLDSLARAGTLPVGIDETSIIDQRRCLVTLINRDKMINNNMDGSMKIDISKKSVREIPEVDEIKNKNQDIRIIEELVSVTKTNEISDIRTSFKEIGELCENISPYDTKRDNADNIRYKYGYLKQSNKKINKKGFYFEKLQQLKTIFDNESEIGMMSNNDLTSLKNNFSHLNKKLLYILKQERQFIHKQDILNQLESFSDDNDEFSTEFIRICNKYYEQLMLKRMNDELTTFFNILPKYEVESDRYAISRMLILMGDLSKELTDCYIDSNDDLCVVLKNLYSIRSKLIHMHTKIKLESEKLIYQLIELLDCLHKLISHNLDVAPSWAFERDGGGVHTLKEKTEEILDHLKKSTKAKEESVRNMQSRNTNNKNTKNNLDVLIAKASEAINSVVTNEARNDVVTKLSNLNEHYQNQLNLLPVVDRNRFPSNLDMDHVNEINLHKEIYFPLKSQKKDESEKMKLKRLKDKFDQKIEDIDEELDYLMNIECDSNIDPVKKKYIIHYFVIVITQYVRDAGEIYRKSPSSFDIILNSQINQFGIANVLLDETVKNIDKSISKSVLINSNFERNSIKYLFTFPEFETNSITSITLCNVGVSFFKLGLYAEAIRFLGKAKEHILECKDKIKLENQSNLNIETESGYEINNSNISSLRKDRYSIFIKRTLANVLHAADRNDEAQSIFEEIHKRIKCNINDLDNFEIKTELIDCLIDFAFFLTDTDQFQKAIEVFEKIIDFTEDISIKMKYLEAVYNNRQFPKANELLDHILGSFVSDITKCKVLSSFISICVCHGDIETGIEYAKRCISRIDNMRKDSAGIINNESILGKLKIVYGRLRSDTNNTEILEVEFKELCNNMQHKFENNSIITLINMSFSLNYTRYIFDHFNEEKFYKAKQYLDKAKFQYDLSGKQILNINHKLRTTAYYIFLAVNKYMEKTSKNPESNIKYLNEMIDIENQLEIKYILTYKNLAIQHYILWKKEKEMVESYERCIHFRTKYSDELEKRSGMEKYELINTSMIYVWKKCSLYYYKLAVENHDMNLMNNSYLITKTLLEYSFPVSDLIALENCQRKCVNEISSFSSFLVKLRNDDVIIGEDEINSRMAKFCNNTFGLNLQFNNGILTDKNFQLIPGILESIHNFLFNAIDVV